LLPGGFEGRRSLDLLYDTHVWKPHGKGKPPQTSLDSAWWCHVMSWWWLSWWCRVMMMSCHG